MTLLAHRRRLQSDTDRAACVWCRMHGAREGAVVEWWVTCFLFFSSTPTRSSKIQTRSYLYLYRKKYFLK